MVGASKRSVTFRKASFVVIVNSNASKGMIRFRNLRRVASKTYRNFQLARLFATVHWDPRS